MAAILRRRPLLADDASGIDHAAKLIDPINKRNNAGLQIVRINIKPTASGRKWRAYLDGEMLCASAAPLVTAARLLIARGFDSSSTVEMWHQDADACSLRGRLGAVAAVILDGERKAQRHAKNGVPVRQIGQAGAAP